MSMLAIVTPSSHAPFQRAYPWDAVRSQDYSMATTTRPRTDAEKIALPSIRQAIPELHLAVPQERGPRSVSATTSPVVGLPGVMTPPEYVHSPSSHKRRRLSIDEERDERISRVPRLYTTSSPRSASLQGPGGAATSPILAPHSATESWVGSSRTSPYLPTSAGLPSMRSPMGTKPAERAEYHHHQPALPSLNLPLPGFARDSARPARGHSVDDYSTTQPLGVFPHMAAAQDDARHRFRQAAGGAYPLSYNHPTRSHSLSVGSISSFDHQPPFPGAPGVGQYPDYVRMGEFANMGLSGDNKQRKRRGNLPKETTDKLRAWFLAHLHHPYPTEEEKQQLMKQTNLQMNQISNWFINARRRQLPTMINNARAESDATSIRSSEGKLLTSGERVDFDDSKGDSPVSDDGRNCFEAQLDDMKRRRAGHMKRGSV